ncbi:thioredoxin family protein [Cytobacillus sp. FSL K6-0265]|uniref:thioredoxin family protein n=1 Tax=Cytobacillus sp. FSL K6-0265 TaxID=2921448 RepID=UPI0030F510AD
MNNPSVLKSINEVRAFIKENTFALLYIWSDHCSVCHALYPKLSESLLEFQKVKLGKVNYQDVSEIAGEFLVFSVPTVILFKEGKEYLREGRFMRVQEFKKQLKPFI